MRGELLWALDLSDDPTVRAALHSYDFEAGEMPLTGSVGGGVTVWVATLPARGTAYFTPDGRLGHFEELTVEPDHMIQRIGDLDEILIANLGSLYPRGTTELTRVAIDPIPRRAMRRMTVGPGQARQHTFRQMGASSGSVART